MSTISTIIGRKGSGKTSAALAHALSSKKRIVAVDCVGAVAKALGKAGRAARHVNFASHVIEELRDPPQGKGVICFQGELRQIPLILKAALTVGDLCLLVDELDALEGEADIFKELKNLVRLARNQELDVVLTSKRRAWLPLLTLTEVDRLDIFTTIDEATLKECSRLHRDFVTGIADLEPFEFIEYRPAEHILEPGYVTQELQIFYHSELMA